jgi:hypothetical protein
VRVVVGAQQCETGKCMQAPRTPLAATLGASLGYWPYTRSSLPSGRISAGPAGRGRTDSLTTSGSTFGRLGRSAISGGYLSPHKAGRAPITRSASSRSHPHKASHAIHSRIACNG